MKTIIIIFLLWCNPFFYYSNHSSIQLNSSTIKLPSPVLKGTVSIEETLLNRRSVREFKKDALTIQQVSQILWAAYGITKEMNSPPFLRGGFKTAPSAGALYPLEIYLVVGNVNGLSKGIYKYLPEGHQLLRIYDNDVRNELSEAALNQEFINQAPVSLVYSAVFERTTKKYGKRGRERYVCMDMGHSAENVCLQAVALGLGTCAVGAFDDTMVKNVIMMPNEEEPLYILPIGFPTGGGQLQGK
ncbi:MAG: nitroreductase [Bacteroidetes bacterium GWF2_33_16]|nr:MAG: nitroreductase [Bacteroidetes bacterium GWE2_32_14]OFY07718.1 MAG: nitroreductase [Bacteroidetes bacterium GWF2_33_16]